MGSTVQRLSSHQVVTRDLAQYCKLLQPYAFLFFFPFGTVVPSRDFTLASDHLSLAVEVRSQLPYCAVGCFCFSIGWVWFLGLFHFLCLFSLFVFLFMRLLASLWYLCFNLQVWFL